MTEPRTIPELTSKQQERFWARISIDEGGCWTWHGSRSNGYGQYDVGGEHWRAHRLAYALSWGLPVGNQSLDHLCGNTLCVNPWHLEPVTPKVNSQRNRAMGHTGFYRNIARTGESYGEIEARFESAEG